MALIFLCPVIYMLPVAVIMLVIVGLLLLCPVVLMLTIRGIDMACCDIMVVRVFMFPITVVVMAV